MVFTVFSSGSKNQGIYNFFFGLGVAKHWYLRTFQLVAFFSSCQRNKNAVNYSALLLGKQQKTATIRQKVSKMDLQNAS